MKKNSIYIFSLIVIALFCTAATFNSYAFFDVLSRQDSIILGSGEWDYGMSASTYYTGFEDAYKPAYAAGNIVTGGMTWHFYDALIGASESDAKYGNQSARLRNGYIETRFGIKNLRILNFAAMAFSGDSFGVIEICLSANQTDWYTYQSVAVTDELKYYHIYFVESALSAMSLGRENELYLRFAYNNGGNRVNIDEVRITYVISPYIELEFFEDFETAVKGNNNTATVNINGLNWLFSSALIGEHSNDRKIGNKAVRISGGYIATQFRIANIKELSFYLASFGNDRESTAYVEISKDNVNWARVSPYYASTAVLVKHTIVFDNALLAASGLSAGDALYIRITSEGNRRVNVDNLSVKYIGIDSLITG